MLARSYAHHFETTVEVDAPPEALFAQLDDHEVLASHMMQSSAMMGGSRMFFEFDAARGRAVGSKIRMFGRMLGLTLDVSEVVTERVVPEHKVWETVGTPRLLVVGSYRMGFRVKPRAAKVLGRLLGPTYARWCAVSMAGGAAAAFRRQILAA
jgi:hypothetical protein